MSRSPLAEDQGSARHDEQDGHYDEDNPGPSSVQPEGNVAPDVKWQEYDREQGYDGECIGLHWCLAARGGWPRREQHIARKTGIAPTVIDELAALFHGKEPAESDRQAVVWKLVACSARVARPTISEFIQRRATT